MLPGIGVLFDIDELGGGLYGYSAYKIFFSSVDTRRLKGCILKDGDTQATLSGRANEYCIAIQTSDPAQVSYIRQALGASTAQGLLPPARRFVDGSVVQQEPLVIAGQINALGEIVNCQTGWVMSAWKENQGAHPAEPPIPHATTAPSTPPAKKWWQFWK